MPTPKGMRAQRIAPQDGDAVHIYSRPGTTILQLRRDVATENGPKAVSFKTAVQLITQQALAVACELLTAANSSIGQAAPQS